MSLKCIVFLYVIKYIIVNDCFVICVGSSLLSKTVDVTFIIIYADDFFSWYFLSLLACFGIKGEGWSSPGGCIDNLWGWSRDYCSGSGQWLYLKIRWSHSREFDLFWLSEFWTFIAHFPITIHQIWHRIRAGIIH